MSEHIRNLYIRHCGKLQLKRQPYRDCWRDFRTVTHIACRALVSAVQTFLSAREPLNEETFPFLTKLLVSVAILAQVRNRFSSSGRVFASRGRALPPSCCCPVRDSSSLCVICPRASAPRMSAAPARAAAGKATPAAPGARARAPVAKPAARRRSPKVPASTGKSSTPRAALGGRLLVTLMLVLSGSLLPPGRHWQLGRRHSSSGHAAGQADASMTRTPEGPAAPRSVLAAACRGSTVRALPFGLAWQHGRLPKVPPAMAMAPRVRGLGARPLAVPALLPLPAPRPEGVALWPEPPPG